MYINFLEETLEALRTYNKTFEDVVWIGNSEYEISKEKFYKLADFDYNSGYGTAEIANDLKIVGEDWWLERWEYDGSEGWQLKKFPIRSSNPKEIKILCRRQKHNYWRGYSLKDFNS